MSGEHLRQQRRSADNSIYANRLQKALVDGRLWLFRHIETLSSGQQFTAVISVPSEADHAVLVSRTIDTTGGITGTVSENVTVDTAGTPFDGAANRHQPDPITDRPVTVEHGVTFSGGNELVPIDYPAGGRSGGGSSDANFAIRPGASVAYDITSDDASNLFELEFVVAEIADPADGDGPI